MKIKIDKQYVRCRFCDSAWFIYTLKDSNNVYKQTIKTLQYNCPACGHVQTSRKFNTDEEDLPDNLKKKIVEIIDEFEFSLYHGIRSSKYVADKILDLLKQKNPDDGSEKK